jgi:hypothetical protein
VSVGWVVLKFDEVPNKMWCKRCGEIVDAPMPCKLDTAIAMSEAFVGVHKNCKEKVK